MAYCGNEVMRSYDLFGAFVCHFLDANAGGLPVYSAAELDIGVGGGDDYGGVFFVGVWNVDISLSGIVSIDFLMYIDIFDCKYDYQFESGEETRYCPHYYEHDNSMGKNNVHEAIEAHERAHASYFFNFILSDIYEILTGYALDYGNRTEAEIVELVGSVLNTANEMHRSGSNAAANQAVYDWFSARSYRWEQLNDLGDWKRWRVRE